MRDGDDEEPFALDFDLAPGGVEGADRRTRVGDVPPQDVDRRAAAAVQRAEGRDEPGRATARAARVRRPTSCERIYRYGERHRVKSGITGWAQVHGLRGKTSISDRAEWDNHYIENFSLWFDLKIMMLTGITILRLFRTTE